MAVEESRRYQPATEIAMRGIAKGTRQILASSAPANGSFRIHGDRPVRNHSVRIALLLHRGDIGVREDGGIHGAVPHMDWTRECHYVCTY